MVRVEPGRRHRGALVSAAGVWCRTGPDASGAARMINARAETVATSRAYAGSFARRRCLVPADGWYEWVRRAGGGKQPYFMTPRDGTCSRSPASGRSGGGADDAVLTLQRAHHRGARRAGRGARPDAAAAAAGPVVGWLAADGRSGGAARTAAPRSAGRARDPSGRARRWAMSATTGRNWSRGWRRRRRVATAGADPVLTPLATLSPPICQFRANRRSDFSVMFPADPCPGVAKCDRTQRRQWAVDSHGARRRPRSCRSHGGGGWMTRARMPRPHEVAAARRDPRLLRARRGTATRRCLAHQRRLSERRSGDVLSGAERTGRRRGRAVPHL